MFKEILSTFARHFSKCKLNVALLPITELSEKVDQPSYSLEVGLLTFQVLGHQFLVPEEVPYLSCLKGHVDRFFEIQKHCNTGTRNRQKNG